ncbi:MAG: SAM-dependent methyltransferase [Chloroflexota bacterium]|nr:SAM-dependent methyltransferase [Chloroflexota bacterium]
MAEERRTFGVSAIGVIHRPGWADDATTGEGEYFDPFTESVVEIYPEWAAGLAGIEEFSHLVVVLYMDRAEPRRPDDPLTHQVESLDGMPEVGLFGTRSPRRPNPIGLCYPRLLGRDGNSLRVSGLDGWPGTPVLDVKGYYVRDESRPDATTPGWLRRLWTRHDEERGAQHESEMARGRATGTDEGDANDPA